MANKYTNKETKKAITVELVGGLGNQLFGYHFGVLASHKLGVEPRFILTHSRLSRNRPSSITDFILDHPLEHRSIQALDQVKVRKTIRGLLRRLGFSNQIAESISKTHFSSDIGRDLRSHLIEPGQLVIGYFQSAEYFEALKDLGLPKAQELVDPSSWFLDLDQTAKFTRPIAIHVRRGDYAAPENREIGILKEEYFLEGLRILRQFEGLEHRPVWLFTDSVEEVQSEFDRLLPLVDFWVQPPERSKPAESLTLMSRASGIVISNSTFSWWAAKLGEVPSVVSPAEWFKSLPEPDGLIPVDWTRIPSQWE